MPPAPEQLRAEPSHFRCLDGMKNSEVLSVFNIILSSLQIVSSIELFSWLRYPASLGKNRAVQGRTMPPVVDRTEGTEMRIVSV